MRVGVRTERDPNDIPLLRQAVAAVFAHRDCTRGSDRTLHLNTTKVSPWFYVKPARRATGLLQETFSHLFFRSKRESLWRSSGGHSKIDCGPDTRVRAQLIDVSTSPLIWSQAYWTSLVSRLGTPKVQPFINKMDRYLQTFYLNVCLLTNRPSSRPVANPWRNPVKASHTCCCCSGSHWYWGRA